MAATEGTAEPGAEDSLEEKMTAERFAEALAQDQFSLFAQAIVPLAAGKTGRRHLEIFVRFKEEEEHLLPPGTFFPILEANHLMPQLDRWAVSKVLRWSAERKTKALDWQVPTFNLNLADDTLADEDFATHVFESLTESHIPPDRRDHREPHPRAQGGHRLCAGLPHRHAGAAQPAELERRWAPAHESGTDLLHGIMPSR